jgi:hypothetical protein
MPHFFSFLVVGKLPGKVLVDLEVCALLQLDSTVLTIRSITVKQDLCHIRQSLGEWAYFNALQMQFYSFKIVIDFNPTFSPPRISVSKVQFLLWQVCRAPTLQSWPIRIYAPGRALVEWLRRWENSAAFLMSLCVASHSIGFYKML